MFPPCVYFQGPTACTALVVGSGSVYETPAVSGVVRSDQGT